MRLAPRHAVLVAVVALVLAAGFATTAQANTTLPGLNGKIAFTSQRDFPFVPITGAQRGAPTCQFGGLCANEIYSMNPDGSSPTRLTNNILNDDEAAWLPADGSKIAFEEADSSDTGANIWSMNGDGGSPVQLTNDQNYNSHATYSPDGTRIAFASTADAGGSSAASRLVPPAPNNEGIWIMPAAGTGAGTPTPLLPADQLGAPDGATMDMDPAWSPDGTQIAFTRVTISNISFLSADRLFFASLDERTYIAPASGTGPATPVETYSDADCTQFILPIVGASPLSTITKALQSRLPAGGSCTEDLKPAWSPDGSKLAVWRFTSMSEGVPSPSRAVVPDLSDNGDIVVIPLANPASEVDLSDVSEPTCTDNGGTPACSTDKDPTWSPDGTKIAFDSNRTADGTESSDCPDIGTPTGNCDYEIWTMNADGSGLQQLTDNVFSDTDPDWQRIPPPPTVAPPVTPPVTPAAVPPKVGVAGVRRACVSKSFHVRFHITTTASSVKSVVVKLDGRRIKKTTKGSFTLTINARKLKAGRHRLTITATDSHGKVATTHKSFSVCKAAEPRKRTAPRFTG